MSPGARRELLEFLASCSPTGWPWLGRGAQAREWSPGRRWTRPQLAAALAGLGALALLPRGPLGVVRALASLSALDLAVEGGVVCRAVAEAQAMRLFTPLALHHLRRIWARHSLSPIFRGGGRVAPAARLFSRRSPCSGGHPGAGVFPSIHIREDRRS